MRAALAFAFSLVLAPPSNPACTVYFHASERGENGVEVTAEAVLEAPADQVLATLLDFAHYPEFMPRVRRAERRRNGLVYTEVIAPWPLRDVWFTAAVESGRVGVNSLRMSFTMKDGNIRENTGAWVITPLPGGHARVRYRGRVAFYFAIPGPLLRLVEEHELPKVVQAIRARAAGKAPLECKSTIAKSM
jgi:ribosome-associated toxin RatA of RatAB toxin-antitoxin module